MARFYCKKDLDLGHIVLPCLMKHMNKPGFPPRCKSRIDSALSEPPLWDPPAKE